MSGFRIALTFLTRVPAGTSGAQADMARSIPWFPVVGALVGLAVAVVYAATALVLPPVISACLALATGIVVTGGFHEDGLGDTADAFGGGRDREDRLRIMKDPRQGTFGVLALTLSVLVRVVAIAALPPVVALGIVPTAHAVSRAGALWLTVALPAASLEGLGVSYREGGSRRNVVVGSVVAVAIAFLLGGSSAGPSVVAAIIAVSVTGFLAVRKIGGMTGDVLGAAQQTAEIAILIAAVGLRLHSSDLGPVMTISTP